MRRVLVILSMLGCLMATPAFAAEDMTGLRGAAQNNFYIYNDADLSERFVFPVGAAQGIGFAVQVRYDDDKLAPYLGVGVSKTADYYAAEDRTHRDPGFETNLNAALRFGLSYRF